MSDKVNTIVNRIITLLKESDSLGDVEDNFIIYGKLELNWDKVAKTTHIFVSPDSLLSTPHTFGQMSNNLTIMIEIAHKSYEDTKYSDIVEIADSVKNILRDNADLKDANGSDLAQLEDNTISIDYISIPNPNLYVAVVRAEFVFYENY